MSLCFLRQTLFSAEGASDPGVESAIPEKWGFSVISKTVLREGEGGCDKVLEVGLLGAIAPAK